MAGQQIVQYNGEYYLIDAPQPQAPYGMGAAYFGAMNTPFKQPFQNNAPVYDALNQLKQTQYLTPELQSLYDNRVLEAINAGQMTPFSNMMRPSAPPAQPIIPKPFAGWGAQPGGNANPIPVPAAPQMRPAQATPAPSAPQGQPNTTVNGTNWDLQKINAFQNTGR